MEKFLTFVVALAAGYAIKDASVDDAFVEKALSKQGITILKDASGKNKISAGWFSKNAETISARGDKVTYEVSKQLDFEHADGDMPTFFNGIKISHVISTSPAIYSP